MMPQGERELSRTCLIDLSFIKHTRIEIMCTLKVIFGGLIRTIIKVKDPEVVQLKSLEMK
jgi:hypothetical protein